MVTRNFDEREVSDDEQLNVLLADALSRLDRHEPLNVDQLISAYPTFADEISSFFAISEELGAMLGGLSKSEPSPSLSLQAQRATASLDQATVPMLRDLPFDDATDPKQIGKYEIRRRLGGGEFGRVFLGFDPLAQREVAIKVPTRKEKISNEQRDAFLHEAQSAASLRHDGIAALYEVNDDESGKVCLIYEYVPGPSLHEAIKASPPDVSEAVRWVAEIADALHYAHRKHIVHRDIKPSNIMLTRVDGQWQPRIVDFGLALLRNQSWRDSKGHVVGAFAYMSPEQAKGDSHWATAQSDIFSLGVVLYELLCHRSPWEGSSGSEVLRDIRQRHPAPPRVLNDSVPRELERICLKALAKSPEDRYTTAADMARELREATTVPAKHSGWLRAAAVTTVLLIASGAAGWQFAHRDGAPDPGTLEVPPIAQVMPIRPQEVRLEVRVQLDATPGHYRVLDQSTADLETGDAVQIYAEVEHPGYLYALWYRPNGEVKLLSGEQLETPRPAVQEPPVGPQISWEAFGSVSKGDNLVVAFTKATPLTDDELNRLKQAQWKTDVNQLGERALLEFGYPRSASNLPGPTRGGDQPATSVVTPEKYLGELGTLLKDRWNCNYQVFIFRVNEAGYRNQGI